MWKSKYVKFTFFSLIHIKSLYQQLIHNIVAYVFMVFHIKLFHEVTIDQIFLYSLIFFFNISRVSFILSSVFMRVSIFLLLFIIVV